MSYYQAGHYLDYTPGSAVTAGTFQFVSGKFSEADNDIAANKLGSVGITGIRKVPKEAGGGVTFSAGAVVDFDISEQTAVADGDGASDGEAGVAAYAAADGDSYVYVLLNGLPGPG